MKKTWKIYSVLGVNLLTVLAVVATYGISLVASEELQNEALPNALKLATYLEGVGVMIVGGIAAWLIVWHMRVITKIDPTTQGKEKNLSRSLSWHTAAFFALIAGLLLGLLPCLFGPPDGFCFAFGIPAILLFPPLLLAALIFFVIYLSVKRSG